MRVCEAKPGVRCASDTCSNAQQTLEEYIRGWPGGTPVNPVAAIMAVYEQAGVTRNELAQAVGMLAQERDTVPLPFVPQQRHPAPDLTTYGPVDPEYGPFPCNDGTWNDPALCPSADEVEVEGRTFHRRRHGVYPNWPDGIRVEADRELTNDELRRMAGLVAYAHRTSLRGTEQMSGPFRDGPRSFVMFQDCTKTFSDDIGAALDRFEESLPGYMTEGSPERKTNRSGPGTMGTRLIDPVENPPTISIWYDDVLVED